MLKKKKPKYGRSLMLVAMSCLNSCTTANYSNCPVYPVAGEKVAQELENASYNEFPNTWEWLGRINKLRQELDMCNGIPKSQNENF